MGAGSLVGMLRLMVEVRYGAVAVVVEAVGGVGVVVGVVVVVEVSAAAVGAVAAVAAAEVAEAVEVAEASEAVVELVAELREWYAARQRGGGAGPCTYVLRTGDRTGEQCGGPHSTQSCFGRLTDAWRHQFPDATEIPRWGDLSKAGVAVFDLDYDAILAAMYAVSTSDEGDCYLCVPPDPCIEAAALGAGETAALGASASAAPGAGAPAPSGTASAQVFHTFTLDSGASRSFFRDRTTLTPLSRPVAVSLADPSGGPVLASFSTVLSCPAAPSGSLSGLYLPSFSTKLVSGADLHGPAPLGVSQVDPPPLVEPLVISSDPSSPTEGGHPAADGTPTTRCSPRLKTPPGFPHRPSSPPLQPVAVDTGAAGGGDTGGEDAKGAGPGGAEIGGAETGGTGPGGAKTGDEGFGGADFGGADSGGAASPSGGGAVGAPAAGPGVGQQQPPSRLETPSPQQLREWVVRQGHSGIGAWSFTAPRAAGTRGAGGVGVAGAGGTGATGAGGAGGTAGVGGAGGAAGAGGTGAGGNGCTGGAGAAGPGGACTGGARAAGPRATVVTESLTERREPETRASTPVRARRVAHPRQPAVPGTHVMARCPSSVPRRVALPPTITRLLASVVTDPDFESNAVFALVTELVDFAARSRLNYVASLVTDSESVCPPSVGGEPSLGCDVLEDRHFELDCLAAALLGFAFMQLFPEGDPDALDIPTPHSYTEEIARPIFFLGPTTERCPTSRAALPPCPACGAALLAAAPPLAARSPPLAARAPPFEPARRPTAARNAPRSPAGRRPAARIALLPAALLLVPPGCCPPCFARFSSPATAALGRLILPYLFPELSPFATVKDLVTHLRTSDARYRAALPAEFLDKNPPPMYTTLYFIVTHLPDSLCAVRDHFLALDPTGLTVDLLEKHLLGAETSIVAVGAARGTPRTPFFEGFSYLYPTHVLVHPFLFLHMV
ncbi:unnamed protein product [Closterium sp. NIES-54]